MPFKVIGIAVKNHKRKQSTLEGEWEEAGSETIVSTDQVTETRYKHLIF